MASVLTPVKPKAPSGGGGAGSGGGGWGPGGSGGDAHALRRYKTGMWVGLGAMVMLFAAFTSALVVRKGASGDWRPIALPALLWLNTAVLALSSLTMEQARRRAGFWLQLTAGLGLVFLAGQVAAWRQLAAAGAYLASNPSSSFFYLLTGAHGLHLAGGVLALFYVVFRASRGRAWINRQAALETTALYWHFMDGLWIYLLLMLLLMGG